MLSLRKLFGSKWPSDECREESWKPSSIMNKTSIYVLFIMDVKTACAMGVIILLPSSEVKEIK